MAIIVENGSGVSGANSYITVSGVGVYASKYGYTTWDTDGDGVARTSTAKEQALMRAMRYIEGLNWKGTTYSQSQALQFPRSGMLDRDGREILENVVPQVVVDALCEACMICLPESEIDLQPNINRDNYVNYEQVTGAVTVSYTMKGPIIPRSSIIEDKLRGLLKASFIILGQRG